MTGSLHEKGGTYYAVVRIPDETGKEKQKWISTGIKVAGNNKRKANARLREIIVELEQRKAVYSKDILFTDWLETWMEQKKNEVRLNTWEGYCHFVDKHIRPHFEVKRLKLNDISPQDIQDYYNVKKKSGLSANTIKKHSVIIRGALQDALKKNLIVYDPCDRATLPSMAKFVGKAYTPEQAKELLSVVENDPIKPAIVLALYYGLRRSEVLGLRWRDIDFAANTVSVRNTVVKMKTLIEKEQTKSRASKRTLFIIPETKDYLVELKRKQEQNRELLGDKYFDCDNVCVWDNGEPMKLEYLSRHFALVLKKHRLPKIRFHDLRHTTGSILLNKKLSMKQIQEYLGHEQISTTLDIYGHLNAEAKMEAASLIGSLLKI